ncbi:homocysteine S-methyltransferase [Streptacidiphilus jiangxiensis]|uniref:Homocysteine S-methyltransferase n=1 Tax=Streptacidiphilus jiangxiensis TaxID=235985 RepID=A0A1H7UEJ1_STRJI|nr:homocysteine S-methyltransferase [Streptacidiphilus jiangxiensis]SEL95068.1 homocysteine S-methyltransferase [Streptacidiphilus jiangxiensis]
MTSPRIPLAAALAEGPVVLDGGMSNELAADGHDLSDALWSARLLRDAPDAVAAVHRRYYAAGAQVAITASYQASFEGFARVGVDRAEAEELLRRSVTLAREASGSAPERWVAASVGPYGAVLADGSEYVGRYGLTHAQLRAFHAPRAEVLASAAPDVLAVETIPDVDEAAAVLDAVAGLDVPVWLSYSAAEGRTRAGQPLAEAFALARDNAQVIAVGVNCLAPEEAADAVALAAETTGKPVVVYPNSGEGWDATARAWTGPATFSPDRVSTWLASGALLLGGCCRVGADQIAALAKELH